MLVDGRVPLDLHGAGATRIRFGSGASASRELLATGGDAPILLLEDPTGGLDGPDAHALLAACRRPADEGSAVVATVESAELAAAHATTIAMFVAGRLLSWGAPAVALVPALQLLGAVSRGSAARGSAPHRPGG